MILEKGNNYFADIHFENVLKEDIIKNNIRYVILKCKENTVKAFVSNNSIMYQRKVNNNIEFSTNILFADYDYSVKGLEPVVSIQDFEFYATYPNK